MSDDLFQGWITEEAFITVSHGARQVQRKEVKINQLIPYEKRKFLNSMETEWTLCSKTKQQEYSHLRRQVMPEKLARLCDGHSLGSDLEARRKCDIRMSTSNSIFRRSPGRVL